MYFCATGIEGGSAFAVTLEEHNANVELYRPNWTDTPAQVDVAVVPEEESLEETPVA